MTLSAKLYRYWSMVGILLACTAVESQKLITEYEQCLKGGNDKTIPCTKELVQTSIRRFKNGIPEWHLQRLDPLTFREFDMSMNVGNGLIDVDMLISRSAVRGLSTLKVTSLEPTTNPGRLVVKLRAPQLRASGHYNVKGQMMGLDMNGNSTYFVLCSGVDANYQINIQFDEAARKAAIKSSVFRFYCQNGRIRFNNLVGQGEQLGDVINRALNENFKLITDNMTPAMADRFTKNLDDVINVILEKIPPENAKRLASVSKS